MLALITGYRLSASMAEPTKEGLVRGIRRWELVAIAVNGIIGAGIFGLPSEVFGRIGAYSLFAFGACTLVVALIILCFAEVGSRFSDTGGPYLYAREAFGPLVGFEVGWLIWIARLTAFAANCNLLVGYLSFFWPVAGSGAPRAAIITLIVIVIAMVNIAGVRDAAMVSNFFTIGKLIPLLLFIAIGLFFLQPANYSLGPAPGYGQFSSACLLLIYAFSGFEMAIIPAGEARDPRRNAPFALITAVWSSRGCLHSDSGGVHWNASGSWRFEAAARRRRNKLLRFSGRSDHIGWRVGFNRGQLERDIACRIAPAFRDVRTARASTIHWRGAYALSHAARFNRDHRGRDACDDALRYVCLCRNHQRDCSPVDLCRDVRGVAGVAAARARTARALSRTGRNRRCNCRAGAVHVASRKQHARAGSRFGDRRSIGILIYFAFRHTVPPGSRTE